MKIRIIKAGLSKAQVGKANVTLASPPSWISNYQEPDIEAPIDTQAIAKQKANLDWRKQYPNAPINNPISDWSNTIFSGKHNTDPLGYNVDYTKQPRNWKKTIGNISDTALATVGIGSGLSTFFDNNATSKYFQQYNRDKNISDNMYNVNPSDKGDWNQEGIFRPNQIGFKSKGAYQMGGDTGEESMLRIRIVGQEPEHMAYGGQRNFGLDLGQKKVYSDMNDNSYDSVSNTMQEVHPSEANIEAEKGETLYGDIDGDGQLEHMNIGGKRHVDGGTPLNAPEGSFIFSDTKDMRIKDPKAIKYFGGSAKAGGVTPAALAKKYDINKYKAILEDPLTDPINKQSAQIMVNNYNKKLGNLAMLQESMKGFPDGKPQVVSKFETGNEQQGAPAMAQYGGYLPRAQAGATVPSTSGNIFDPAFQAQLAALKKDKGYDMIYSPRMIAGDNSVNMMQHKQKNGLYGDISETDVQDLKSRHPWYFGNKPNWNPSNENDVLDFQNQYEDAFAKEKGYSYFNGKQPYAKKDKHLGEYTYNAPGLRINKPVQEEQEGFVYVCNGEHAIPMFEGKAMQSGMAYFNSEAEAQANCGKTTTPVKDNIQPNSNTFAGNEKEPFDYMMPDKVNMLASVMNPPKKYMPYRKSLPFEPGAVSFDDWRAQAAQRQANQYINPSEQLAAYTSPQGLASNMSFLAGQAAEGVGQDIAQTNSRNLGIGNQFASQERQRKDQNNMLNAAGAQEYWRDLATTNQQYDNSKRQYVSGINKSFNNAWNNRMNMGMINATNPMYNIDPNTGRSYFKQGYNTSRLGYYGNDDSNSSIPNMKDLETKYLRDKGQTGMTFAEWLRLSGNDKSKGKGVNPYDLAQQQAARYRNTLGRSTTNDDDNS